MRTTKLRIGVLALLAIVLLSLIIARANADPVAIDADIKSDSGTMYETEIYTYESPKTYIAIPDDVPDDVQIPPHDYTVEAEYISKAMYGEAGYCTVKQQAGVAWCILNRVDSEDPFFPDDIIGVVTQYQQFHGYKENNPVIPEQFELALDVIARWNLEKLGVQDVGRVLPVEYLFFCGDGKENYFHKHYQDWSDTWDWSLESPYDE